MTRLDSTPSARKSELLEASYRYVASHGLAELSLRPLASEIGSSPRVLLYLFGSKDGLIRALLSRARQDQLALLSGLIEEASTGRSQLDLVAERLWSWLVDDEHRGLLKVWLEAYALSLAHPNGPWSGFAHETVDDWLTVLRDSQPVAVRDSPEGRAERTAVLALLRGALLDLLATGDVERTTDAVAGRLGR